MLPLSHASNLVFSAANGSLPFQISIEVQDEVIYLLPTHWTCWILKLLDGHSALPAAALVYTAHHTVAAPLLHSCIAKCAFGDIAS